MSLSPLYPFHEEATQLKRYCKLALHLGKATVARVGDQQSAFAQMLRKARRTAGLPEKEKPERAFNAGFLVPASGQALIFLNGSSADSLSRNFGENLTIQGEDSEGPFTLHCPEFYVETSSETGEETGWAIATPVNKTLVISYGEPRPIANVIAIINNFDFEYGNYPVDHNTDRGKTLRVEAAGRVIEFAWRQNHDHLKRLVEAEVLPSTALTTFTFQAWESASEEDLVAFAYDIARLCGVVVQQHTGVPVLVLLDDNGKVVRRLVGNPVESRFRRGSILPRLHFDNGLPKLFQQCFAEHVRMCRSELWSRVAIFCAAIEDPPYLEQKYATLMCAVELLIRNCLIEGNHLTPEDPKSKNLQNLINLAKGKLRWDFPKHYTAGGRHRKLRNAVAHGNDLPYDFLRVRHDFDKWHLFLLRRLLIRLGFDGEVASPRSGYASSSSVDEFSEEHNAYDT